MSSGIFSMLGNIFRLVGRSGPTNAIVGAVLLLTIALVMGIGLAVVAPYVLLLIAVGVGLSLLWAAVAVIKAIA